MSRLVERKAAMRRVPAPIAALTPAPSTPSYLRQAEACLAAAATSRDATARALHEEECRLWLMLARHRSAIDAVVQDCLEPA